MRYEPAMGMRDTEIEIGEPSKEDSPRLSEVKGNSILFPKMEDN